MKKSLLFFVPLITLLISCDKNYNTIRAEKKAIGEYVFEKVVKNYDGVKSDNLTQQYHNMVLQLNDKNEAALIDRNNSITYYGKYDIVEEYNTTTTDDGGNTNTNTKHTIIIDIKSPGRGNDFHWVGEDALFGNKLKFTAKKTDGRYKFKLNKI